MKPNQHFIAVSTDEELPLNFYNMYAIKTKEGAFVEENSNGKELNYVFTDIQMAQHYTQSHLKILYERFKGIWNDKGFEVYAIKYELERCFNWL